MRLDEQRSIIDDLDIDLLTMTSTAISIAKFNGSNYKQWSVEMAFLFDQQWLNGIVTGEDERPEDTLRMPPQRRNCYIELQSRKA